MNSTLLRRAAKKERNRKIHVITSRGRRAINAKTAFWYGIGHLPQDKPCYVLVKYLRAGNEILTRPKPLTVTWQFQNMFTEPPNDLDSDYDWTIEHHLQRGFVVAKGILK